MPRSSTRALSHLTRLPETWLVATTQLRTWIVPPEEDQRAGQVPYRPFVIFILSADEGTMRNTELTAASPTPREVWNALEKAMRRPSKASGKPGVPQRIAVTDPALAGALVSSFADAKLKIDIFEQPVPDEITQIVRDLETHMRGGRPDPPALVSVPGVTPEQLSAFYAAAAAYYRATPWVHLDSFQVIALRIPGQSDYHYAMSMGQSGIEYGLAMYVNWEDVVRQFTEDENPIESLPPGGLHSLFFGDATMVPFDDLDSIEKNHWEIATPDAYPMPIVVRGPEQMHRPSSRELLWYEAALRAIPLLVRDHLKPDGQGNYAPLEMTLEVPTHTGTLAVAIKYPGGEIPLADQPAERTMWPGPEDEDADEGQEVFDRRRMEGPMQQFAQQIGAEGKRGDPALSRAQELMWDAFDEPNPAKRLALAHEALSISPNCADAYVLLAEEEADTLQRALTLYQEGVAAGERALGKKFFKEYAGHFWGLLETRPYMRARQGLADVLWRLKRREQARGEYVEMLRLNPGDNQGIRYLLLALLLDMERGPEAEELLKQYRGDWSAVWQYTRALLEFRKHGASARANKALDDALEENPHVPAYLTARKRIPNRLPELIGMGDANEAISYAADHLNYWRRTPGAIEWLSERKPQPKAKRQVKKGKGKAKPKR